MIQVKFRILAVVIFLGFVTTWLTFRTLRQSNLNDELVGAISNGNTSAVLRLLRSGADPNAKVGLEPFKDTLLQLRGVFNHEHYLNLGQFDTPLATAATFHRIDIARLLLKHGANVDMMEGGGRTPLSHAAQSNGNSEASMNPQMIALLLDHGANINSHDYDGYTPLMYAIFGGQPGNVKLLLARGADPNRRNKEGQTALEFASDRPSWPNDKEIISILKRACASK